jgi:hypothetical protein
VVVLAVILPRVLIAIAAVAVRAVLVRSGVPVCVAQRAVTVHIVFDEFVGSRRHVGQARACRGGRPMMFRCTARTIAWEVCPRCFNAR